MSQCHSPEAFLLKVQLQSKVTTMANSSFSFSSVCHRNFESRKCEKSFFFFLFFQWSLYLFLLPVVQPLDQFWPPVTKRVSSTHFPPLKWGFLLPSRHNPILINLSPSLSPSPSKTPSPSHHHHRHHCYHHHHCTHLYREREGVSPVGEDELTVNPAVHGSLSSHSSHAVA